MSNEKNNVFVGTMESGEGDFLECKKAVSRQIGVHINHCIISGLSEKDAHNELWDSWNENKCDYDYFVKIDADTVLKHSYVIKYVVDIMREHHATGMQVPIHDFFTDGLINGMNCFSPQVIFKKTVSDLYCDRVDTNHGKQIKGRLVPRHIIPCANHCHHSTKKQAFHFGVHRMLKGQRDVIDSVENAWRRLGDDRRLYCLIGAKMSSEFTNSDFNYSDSKFNGVFDDVIRNFDQYREGIRNEI